MQRDLAHFTATKLQGGWSAADFSKYLTQDALRELLPKLDKFEPLVRVRILLSLLTIDKATKQACNDELQMFLNAAREDKEEWVSITAKALGDLQLPLDFEGMLSGSAVVRQTVMDIEARLTDSDDTAYRPLEETYLSTAIVEEARGGPQLPVTHQHFVPRENASGGTQDLYARAKASAASAVAGNPVASSTSAPLPAPAAPVSEGQSRDPGSRAGTASEISGRPAGMEDMFRSSRQQTSMAPSRHAVSSSGFQERRGASRPVHVKVLDVEAVQKLNEAETRKKQQAPLSPEASNVHTQNGAEPSMETEEGEIEAGELCDDSYSEPSMKRMRVAHEATA